MKVVILMSSLTMGGAERVATTLANYLANNGEDVHLISFDNIKSSYPINSNVNFYMNNDKITDNRIKGIIQRFKYFSNIIKKIQPDIIFTMFFQTTFYAMICKMFVKNKVVLISSERCHPKREKTLVKRIINMQLSKMCDGFVFQTERVKQFYPKKVQRNSVVIHNAISNKLLDEIDYSKAYTENIITSMGRLEEQKAHDVMIKSFANVAKEFPEYKLVIYGEGSKRKELENLIEELKLNKRVILPGTNSKALLEVSKSKIFMLTSRYEGMPNALLEAMAVGVPCISTNCEMGPAELINDGKNGYLVEVDNVEQITNTLRKLLSNEKLRNQISLESKKIIDNHSIEYIFKQYHNYFKSVFERKYQK